MSDMSDPPLTLVPLEGDRLAPKRPRAPVAAAPAGVVKAAASSGGFAWPTPSLPCYPAPARASAPLLCEVEGTNGVVTQGRLMHFSPEQGIAHVLVASARAPMPLRFSQFRRLRLVAPLEANPIDPTDTVPLPLTEKRSQPYCIRVGTQKIEGRTLSYEEADYGIFLFEPLDEEGAVSRVFVPRVAFESFEIGVRLGEALIEQQVTTAAQVDEALEQQQLLRNQKLGEMLIVRQLITPPELERAIEEQARMPMVRIGQALTALGFITETQLEAALAEQQRDRSVPLGELLVRSGKITRQDLQTALARKMGYPLVDVANFPAELEALQKVPYGISARLPALPLMVRGGRVIVALEDPTQRSAIDELEFATQCKVIPVLARAKAITGAVDKAYEKLGVEVMLPKGIDPGGALDFAPEDSGKLLATLEQEGDHGGASGGDDEKPIEQSDNSLVRMINTMILEAQNQGVSDIHIECQPGKDKVKVRFRKDGVMRPYLELPPSYRSALIARIKIMCDLDISERRKPQDGKINFGKFVQGQRLELRVATIPTNNNLEDAVMRLLASARPLPVEKLGLSPVNEKRLKAAVERPYGMFLCVGPTGSGKTTTLHSAIGSINTPERKIWTAEDPIEITQAGLRQVQVNPKIELTFARALRAFLRADPDVIMVGEIRDQETAQMAIEASLTGHLVLSTLHTNSAPETVTRLLDMGMDPFNFADALLAVLAQRLVRRWCGSCAAPREALPDEVDELLTDYMTPFRDVEGAPGKDEVLAGWKQRFARDGKLHFVHAPGCPGCDQSGYRGRAGVHELMSISPELRKLITTGGRVAELQRTAVAEGMRTLRQDGLEKVLAGVTSLAEVRSTTNG